jgi:LDH2 family malate/lactate/ureidoglycolate dehydrogenase
MAPNDPEAKVASIRTKEGIPVDVVVAEALSRLAVDNGLEVPW